MEYSDSQGTALRQRDYNIIERSREKRLTSLSNQLLEIMIVNHLNKSMGECKLLDEVAASNFEALVREAWHIM